MILEVMQRYVGENRFPELRSSGRNQSSSSMLLVTS